MMFSVFFPFSSEVKSSSGIEEPPAKRLRQGLAKEEQGGLLQQLLTKFTTFTEEDKKFKEEDRKFKEEDKQFKAKVEKFMGSVTASSPYMAISEVAPAVVGQPNPLSAVLEGDQATYTFVRRAKDDTV